MKMIAVMTLAVVFAAAFACQCFAFDMDIEFAGGGRGKVVFSHMHHTETVKKKCNECHTILFQRKAGATRGITMKAMEEGGFCGACHNGERGEAFDVGSETNCAKCHQG